MTARYRIGVDENGLGPRLGPLVVTAVLARVTDEGARSPRASSRGALAERLGDSKAMVVARRRRARRGVGARARARGARRTARARRPDALIHAISARRRRDASRALPVARRGAMLDGRGRGLRGATTRSSRGRRAISTRSRRRASRSSRCASVILCTERLNDGARRGHEPLRRSTCTRWSGSCSRSRATAGADVTAVCGKVGGYRQVLRAFGPLGGRLHACSKRAARGARTTSPASARSPSCATRDARTSASRWPRWSASTCARR